MTIAAIAVAGTATAATSSTAAAATPRPAHQPRTAPRQINLHLAFERALRGTKAGRIAGIVPPRGSRGHGQAQTGRSLTACMEPDCNLSYGGGAVQHTPHVYLVLWGPGWSSTTGAATYLADFYTGLGASPEDTWSTITSQYGDGSGSPSFGASVYAGTWNDTSTPPKSVTPNALAAEADAIAATIGIKDQADAQVVIASQHGTCFSDGFAGSCGVVSMSSTGYCAWHSMSSGSVPFTNLPYQLDAGGDCGQDWINSGSAGTYDGFSTVGGHEYAETITDPDPTSGWFDAADSNVSGGEIGDKCAWGGQPFGVTDPAEDITLSTGSFAMQSLWSNAGGSCVMSAVAGPTVISPGTQTSTLGVAVDLAIAATPGSSSALTYAALGLPAGLKINPTTGHITGTPATTAGTWHPAVTVSDGTQSARVSFTWLVSSKAGPVKGYAAKCLDDYRGSAANGTKVDLWGCYGKVRQRVTFQANGELRLDGKCVTDKKGVTVLEPCTGTAAQTWTRRATGEYVVKAGGVCLAVPVRSTANGTQLRLSACTNSARERWSLP